MLVLGVGALVLAVGAAGEERPGHPMTDAASSSYFQLSPTAQPTCKVQPASQEGGASENIVKKGQDATQEKGVRNKTRETTLQTLKSEKKEGEEVHPTLKQIPLWPEQRSALEQISTQATHGGPVLKQWRIVRRKELLQGEHSPPFCIQLSCSGDRR